MVPPDELTSSQQLPKNPSEISKTDTDTGT